MSGMMSGASMLALDFYKQTKFPCLASGFDYFTRLHVVMVVPLATCAGIIFFSFVWACIHKIQLLRSQAAVRADVRAAIRSAPVGGHDGGKDAASVFWSGILTGAPLLLLMLDLLYPTTTRTILQYFTCRDLVDRDKGGAGLWLEADVRGLFSRSYCAIDADSILVVPPHFSLYFFSTESTAKATSTRPRGPWRLPPRSATPSVFLAPLLLLCTTSSIETCCAILMWKRQWAGCVRRLCSHPNCAIDADSTSLLFVLQTSRSVRGRSGFCWQITFAFYY